MNAIEMTWIRPLIGDNFSGQLIGVRTLINWTPQGLMIMPLN
jgi:hypothetical protein